MLTTRFTAAEIAGVAATLEAAADLLQAAVVRMEQIDMADVGAHFATTKNIHAAKVFAQCQNLNLMVEREANSKAMNAPGVAEKASQEYRQRKQREVIPSRPSKKKGVS